MSDSVPSIEHGIESAFSDLFNAAMGEEFADFVADAIQDETGEQVSVLSAVSFTGAGVLTRDAGVVLRMRDGSEFQITIVRSA